MKYKIAFILCLCVAVLHGGVDRPSQLDDIREATFLYQFENNASCLQKDAKVYFLSLFDPETKKDNDPSDALMARFAGHTPRVARPSEVRASADKDVSDKKTDEPGIIFRVSGIIWKTDDEVEVSGGYYEARMSSSGNTYFLKKKKGKWVVERDKMHWISENRPNKSVQTTAMTHPPSGTSLAPLSDL